MKKDLYKYFLFIYKLRNYEPDIVKLIENILGIPKFKTGDFFRITTRVKNLYLHRECQVYNIIKIKKTILSRMGNLDKSKIRMNYYKYFYINRISGRIGYQINEDKMIPVIDQKVTNDSKNIWI